MKLSAEIVIGIETAHLTQLFHFHTIFLISFKQSYSESHGQDC